MQGMMAYHIYIHMSLCKLIISYYHHLLKRSGLARLSVFYVHVHHDARFELIPISVFVISQSSLPFGFFGSSRVCIVGLSLRLGMREEGTGEGGCIGLVEVVKLKII
jgi:hypothetical protein